MANERMPAPKQESASVGSAAKRAKLDAGDVKAMPSKQYMDEFVVPTMLRALSAVNKERPSDPIEFLIAYLSKEQEKTATPSPVPSATPTPTPTPTPPQPPSSSAAEEKAAAAVTPTKKEEN